MSATTAKVPRIVLLFLPFASAAQFASFLTFGYLLNDHWVPGAYLCSLWFAFPGFLISALLSQTKIRKLRAVVIGLAAGMILGGLACGGSGMIDVRGGSSRLPVRTSNEIASAFTVFCGIGMPLGAFAGAMAVWLQTHCNGRLRGKAPPDTRIIADTTKTAP